MRQSSWHFRTKRANIAIIKSTWKGYLSPNQISQAGIQPESHLEKNKASPRKMPDSFPT